MTLKTSITGHLQLHQNHGEQRVKGGNYIVGAEQTSREILCVTDDSSHRVRYLGNDFVFGFDQVGSYGGLASQQAIVDNNGTVYWMGLSGFYMYDQSTVRKLEGSLDRSLFDIDRVESLNLTQKEKVFARIKFSIF